ncbi:MAG: beta-ketoacyl synthase N-terminal-like domain-containing protein [Gemmataceae bacterium]
MDRSVSQSTPPLAVIGIGCLFPGANDFPTFWSRIVGRADAIREVPPTHWRIEDYLDPDPKAPDRIYAARGGFLDPVSFNPQAFGIPPSNLEATDASQLLGLLVAQQALDDCGYVLSGEAAGKKLVDRNRVSVILGVTGTLQLVIPLGARLGHPLWRRALREAGVDEAVADDVVQRIADGYVPWQENSFPGLLGNVVAGRIANRFDMGGTNCVVDAACASSLSAIHLAAMELTTGRADLVLTGGVDTFNDIFMFTCFSKTPALSPTGNARPFDAAGDGTVLGEGLGMVVLKRLDDARRDGDRIYAVLRGVGSSSDGKGNAIYAPRKEGQVDALTSAYRISGVTPDTIELVEAHGTGTRVGDATEVSALAEVFGRSGRAAPWCAVGSIKSQIGHTKAAAGVAGLIKAVASLYHKVLPPTIKVSKPLDVFQEPGCPLYVNTEQRPWLPSPHHPRRAAVSAFGFGGSNFHAVLEEADPRKPAISWTGQVQIVPFAAESKPALIQRMKEFSTQQTWEALHRQADDLRRAFTPTAPWRLVLVVEREKFDLARLTTRALALLEREDPRSLPAEGLFVGHGPAGRMGVLFPGQGAQYVGMFRDLVCHFPAAFDVLTQADASFAETSSRRLVDLLYPPPAFSPEAEAAQEASLRATDVAQPALGAVSLAGWRVLQKFGLRATAFAGHSYGELTALAAAGWLGDTDFFSLSALRGRLMAEAGQARDAGAMLAAKAGLEELRAILAEEQIDLVLANKNAPRQTVLSGTNENIERAAAVLARRSIGTVRLTVAAAFHSPLVAAARAPFAQALTEVTLTPGVTVYANTTAQVYPSRTDEARDLLAGQLAQPVEWVRLIEAMASDGITEFLEVGPGGRLAGLVDAILAGRSVQIATWDATQGQRSGWTDLAMVLAWLAARGQTVDLASWDPLPPRTEAPGRPGLQVELSGVNYVKPRTPRPPRAPLTPPTSPRSEAPMQAPLLQNGSSRGERSVQMPPPPPPSPPSPAPAPAPLAQASSPVDATALGRALEITRESLATLQQMQEQTAQVHRQYLDGQENAQRTVHLLVEQQHRLLQASLGMPVAPLPALQSAPARAMAPAPVVTPRPTPQARPAPVPVPPPPSARPASPPPAPRVEQRPTHAPVAPPPPAPAPSTQANGRVEKVLLEVIAEKTGYPAEMLELGMSLDADLGIDSIKRVEILSALQERLPDAPTVKPEHLGTLHTLGDITAFLAGSTGVVASTTAPAPSSGGSARVEKVLLEVIAEKTGYPAEMLELGMSLDADLGIDSIKRVEILSALQERLPDAPTVKPEHLGTLHTLGDITAFLAGSTGAPAPIRAPEPSAPGPTPSPRTVPSPAVQPSGVLERSVVRAVPLTGSRAEDGWMPGGEIWIADDSTPMAEAIADLLRERGLAPRLVSLEAPPEGTPHGLILVAPSGPLAEEWLWQAAPRAVQVAGSSLRQRGGRFLTVASLDGSLD